MHPKHGIEFTSQTIMKELDNIKKLQVLDASHGLQLRKLWRIIVFVQNIITHFAFIM